MQQSRLGCKFKPLCFMSKKLSVLQSSVRFSQIMRTLHELILQFSTKSSKEYECRNGCIADVKCYATGTLHNVELYFQAIYRITEKN